MGCFITFEGIEGCGKTTQLRQLQTVLANCGRKVQVTREPGGCAIADQVRSILLDARNNAMTPLAELLLYAAARAQHVAEVIAPVLAGDGVVICDRFTDATLAYQGYARGLDLDLIRKLNVLACGAIRPDLTILLDCPVEVGLARAVSPVNEHGVREERFERESLSFHQRVRDGYLALASQDPGRIRVIAAARPADEVAADVLGAVHSLLAAR
jgi:dTMP kinase